MRHLQVKWQEEATGMGHRRRLRRLRKWQEEAILEAQAARAAGQLRPHDAQQH